MQSKTTNPDAPYHLRAPRLRWAAFAVTMDDEELQWVQTFLASPKASPYSMSMARMLIGLHQREEISKLCADLHFSRRKLLEFADFLTTKEGRRRLLSQPLHVRGRPPSSSKH